MKTNHALWSKWGDGCERTSADTSQDNIFFDNCFFTPHFALNRMKTTAKKWLMAECNPLNS